MIERDKDGWAVLKAGMMVRQCGVIYKIIHLPGGKLALLHGVHVQDLGVSVDEWCRSFNDDISTDDGKTWHKYEQVKPESPKRFFVNWYGKKDVFIHETRDAAVSDATGTCTDIAREYVRADKVLPWVEGCGKAENVSLTLEVHASGSASAVIVSAGDRISSSASTRIYRVPISALVATLPNGGK